MRRTFLLPECINCPASLATFADVRSHLDIVGPRLSFLSSRCKSYAVSYC
jgi:hypothetical protein